MENPATATKEGKIFNDPIHGFIKLDLLLVKIINTPQFQRLKDIKQLGICDFVYPGATHTRFEHSLGTSYLCGKLIDTLQELHRGEIEITDKECMCIKIAGLCHDLGHGPFSHFFEEEYIKKQRPEWQHEDASCELFEFMLKENSELKQSFDDFPLDHTDIKFIKELIKGKNPNDVTRKCELTHKYKCFLYEIVSNKRNGIDCDKFDYFARDCANVGVKSTFDHRRYFQNVRIMSNPDNQQLQICVRDKEVFNLYELFHTRWSLHQRVYQHKTKAPIEDLLFQAFEKVDEVMKISDAVKKAVKDRDMGQYCVLTDSILHDILRNETPVFKEAQDLIKRIQNRKIYKFCGQSRQILRPESKDDSPSLQESKDKSSSPELKDDEICTKIAEDLAQNSEGKLKKEDTFVFPVKINFGMKGKNPIDAVMFFNKSLEVIRIKREQVSGILPRDFEDKYFRVYARNPDHKELIRHLFIKWCSGQKNFQEPFGG
ncbi:deoxynucleoside triphosphate triphosphohydrolase SAMHD1-like [Xenia sp. Carnegie-2017]|uniref:deoxynucleoside triphosphate triphosphohydrolase SAMHD1-like n=1 Tax=Xenia sp. Carnegie-2017 TaxID=2897299 RepID=UPI001F040A15|nr:deoxynucleoside triphosphate triphosphohydrolase SAMHD1-like [Xenia sp. Carnegie-2017]XP_046842769.1 deoxynucleoside triphosphate triphosphohydrolase SAMHD1-like [Xenia sp. Carnegie-2017]XP_046842770.1 deoxynucleoside triphosphate triphosphohydrolase SAMHD1-like [Xenia sp. Carnegie-2017]